MDTLAGVAVKYGVEVADIRRTNGLVTDLQMFALEILRIPPVRHPPSPVIPTGTSNNGFSSTTKGAEIVWVKGLVPGIDFCNHAEKGTGEIAMEINISYGNKGNEEQLKDLQDAFYVFAHKLPKLIARRHFSSLTGGGLSKVPMFVVHCNGLMATSTKDGFSINWS